MRVRGLPFSPWNWNTVEFEPWAVPREARTCPRPSRSTNSSASRDLDTRCGGVWPITTRATAPKRTVNAALFQRRPYRSSRSRRLVSSSKVGSVITFSSEERVALAGPRSRLPRRPRRALACEARREVSRLDRAQNGIGIARGVDFDPGAADVASLVGVVRRHLGQVDRLHVVFWLIDARVRYLHGVDGDPLTADPADASQRLIDGEGVAGRVIEDVERLLVAGDLPHVLRQRAIVELDPGQDDQPVVAGRETHPVVGLDQLLVVRDGEKVVAEITIACHHRLDGQASVREGRVGMKVALQGRHALFSLVA